MCKTMNELEKVVADYRSLKALKEELEEQLKDAEREIIGYLDSNEKLTETGSDFTVKISTCREGLLIANVLKLISDHCQSTRESVSTEDYM